MLALSHSERYEKLFSYIQCLTRGRMRLIQISPLRNGGDQLSYARIRWLELAKKYRGPGRWDRFYERLLGDIDLQGKSVLDIGGGVGLAATYALTRGARRATLLEPEAAGSRNLFTERADIIRAELAFEDCLDIRTATLQDFDGTGSPFDIAILEASINHLDEEAVMSLLNDNAALARYNAIFSKLASLLRPDAHIVISDCARRNFFGDFRLRNPFVPTIEWQKHQQPKTWIKLLRKHGFDNARVHWGVHSTLGLSGRLLLDNAFAFYFLSSYFILTMRYMPGNGDVVR